MLKQSKHKPVNSIRKNLISDVAGFIGEANRHDDLSLIGTKIRYNSNYTEEINE